MAEDSDNPEQTPLVPAYPFNAPGEAIQLYEGLLSDFGDRRLPGVITFRSAPEQYVVWRLDDDELDPWEIFKFDLDQVELRVRHPSGEQVVTGHCHSAVHGWLNSVAIGSDTSPLTRVLVHWLNLPTLHSPIWLKQGDDSHWRRWNGRWQTIIGDWDLTLDRRPDHRDVWNTIDEDHTIAMTHVMEIRRADGQTFTATDFEPVLQALHLGVSFALARWVAPALPVGFDSEERRVWELWAPSICEPGHNSGLAWWFYPLADDLEDFLRGAFKAFGDPDRVHTTSMLLAMSLQSNRSGRVEQRIMTAFSAIEHLSWVILKLGEGMSGSAYKALNASGRLRRLLVDAQVPTDIDAGLQPALARFAANEAAEGQSLDGPATVALVRNRLVHPKAPQDEVYHVEGLVADTWLLTRHYLNLLILHWLGYSGTYQTVLGPGGWAGDVKPVPWAAVDALS